MTTSSGWTYKLKNGPYDGETGPLLAPTPRLRVPEGFYRRDDLAYVAAAQIDTPTVLEYEWVAE